jgi:hypothetical protein
MSQYASLGSQARKLAEKRAAAPGGPLSARLLPAEGPPKQAPVNKMLAEQYLQKLLQELPQPNQRNVESVARTRREVRKAAGITPLGRRLLLYGGAGAVATPLLASLHKTPEQRRQSEAEKAYKQMLDQSKKRRQMQQELHNLMFSAKLRTDRPQV